MIRFHHLALASFSVLLSGCHDMFPMGEKFSEEFEKTGAMKPGSRLSVETSNGSIEVIGWDKNEIEVTGKKWANSEDLVKATTIEMSFTETGARLRAIFPKGFGNMGASFSVRVPHDVLLDRVNTSNASIRLEDLVGSGRAHTSNGSIQAHDLAGPFELETSNASITVNRHTGNLLTHTSNGSIHVDDLKGQLDGKTSNSSITVSLDNPSPGKPVRLETSNGSIKLDMRRMANNDLRLKTSNSSIELEIPSNAKASIRAHTSSHERVKTNLPIEAQSGGVGKSNLEGSLNGGSLPRIELETSNGDIHIRGNAS